MACVSSIKGNEQMKRMISNKTIMVTLLIFIVGILCANATLPARAAIFVVDTSADDVYAHDKNPGDGICADTYDYCTLRAAIEEANAHAGSDLITFNSELTIILDKSVGALPTITEAVYIDASSLWSTILDQPGVTINGSGGNFNGLTLNADGCSIYGLQITNFGNSGMYIYSGINFIGYTDPGNSNVIGGNNGSGIALVGSSARDNVILNNYIGTDLAGAKNGNTYGIYIAEGAYNNLIGGISDETGNIIAGNYDGIYIIGDATHGNAIGSNLIGGGSVTGKNGENIEFPGNDRYGIAINQADSNAIGDMVLSGNAIVKNGSIGIYLTNGANANYIMRNGILQNGQHGILISDSANTLISTNLIGQNQKDGIRVMGSSAVQNQLFGNMISSNTGKGIELMNGANLELSAPTITSASDQGASGKACANCAVYISSDHDDEGQFVHGTVNADAQGDWTFSGSILLQNVTALTVDLDGNTSEYSTPYSLSFHIYVPLLLKP